ncbi:MAG: hypothetical protein QOH16_3889 [Gaiellaceae bacterium]|nr:hypothetical protein [Gaiellaceae bacterium]
MAAARLMDDRDCWFITANPERGPDAIPLSFLAYGPQVVLATAVERPAVRNVMTDPRVVLVLGGYRDAIRLTGEAAVVPFGGIDAELRMRYVAKAGWDPGGGGFVGLVVTLGEILCSRSPAEDRDRVVWKAGAPTHW